MNNASISQLKTNPSAVIDQAVDYPVAVENRNTIKAYVIGKNLFEKIVKFIEDYSDIATIRKTDFKKGKDFESVAQELGL